MKQPIVIPKRMRVTGNRVCLNNKPELLIRSHQIKPAMYYPHVYHNGVFTQLNECGITESDLDFLEEKGMVCFPLTYLCSNQSKFLNCNHISASQLNGSNGEVTEKDDVKKGQKKSKKIGNSKKKTSVQVVVNTESKRPKSQKKGKSLTITRGKNSASPAFTYMRAIAAPCTVGAEEARVPDEYAISTSTLRSHGTQVIKTSSGQTDFDFVWIGRPYQSYWSNLEVQTVIDNCYTPYATPNAEWGYACTPAALATELSTYRMVANGIVVRSIQPVLSATGRLHISRVPMTKNLFGPGFLGSGQTLTNDQSLKKICGIGVDTQLMVPVNIRECGESIEYTVNEMEGREIWASNKPVSGKAFDFCSSLNLVSAAGWNVGDQTMVDGVDGSVKAIDSSDVTNSDGWTCLLIRGRGFPANTSILEIESCIHIEGTPSIVTSTEKTTFVPSTKKIIPIVGALDRVLNQIAKLPLSMLVDTVSKVAMGGKGGGVTAALRSLGL